MFLFFLLNSHTTVLRCFPNRCCLFLQFITFLTSCLSFTTTHSQKIEIIWLVIEIIHEEKLDKKVPQWRPAGDTYWNSILLIL